MNSSTNESVSMLKSEDEKESANFTTLLIVIFSCTTAVGLIIISLTCVIFVIRRKRKYAQNGSPNASISKCLAVGNIPKPNQAGVIQTEQIEFVLPSYTSAEPTEEEVSEYEPGNYKYSYVHNQLSGQLTVPNQIRRTPSTGNNLTDNAGISPYLYLSSEGEEEQSTVPPNINLGKVGFSLKYRNSKNQLLVTITGANNFPVKRTGKTIANPHIKVMILPEKHPKFFTKILKNTSSPVFNEEFIFTLKKSDAASKILQLTMCDFDRFTRRIAIGHVFLPLKSFNFDDTSDSGEDLVLVNEDWRCLVSKYIAEDEMQGQLFLSLCYNSDIRNLRLGIHKLRNLKPESEDIVCLYAKVTLSENGKIIKTRKTSAVKKTMEPDFAETFNIKINNERTQNIFCTISICSRNRYGSARKVIGRTQIGPYTLVTGPGADHWSDAFHSPKSTVTQWHNLY